MSEQAWTIEVYSDIVCPWCYVGKRRLEKALAQLGERERPQILWRPFELNPTMPEGGTGRRDYLEAKFGSLDALARLEEQVRAAGEAEGIAFVFERIARTPNTFHAHRLIWHAARQGRQDAVVEALFTGYFEEGADIGAQAVLTELAARAGLDAEAFLRGDEGTAEVRAEEADGLRLGIRAVPYFILNRAYGLSGAQPAEVFRSAIVRVLAQRTAPAVPSPDRR